MIHICTTLGREKVLVMHEFVAFQRIHTRAPLYYSYFFIMPIDIKFGIYIIYTEMILWARKLGLGLGI